MPARTYKVVPITPKCLRVKGVGVQGSLPYKLVAIDMDGTLLNAEHEVTVRTRRVLAQLLAMGVHVVFATGRPFTDVHRIKRRLEIFAREQQIPTMGFQVSTPTAGASPSLPGSPATGLIVPRCFAITSNGACVYDEFNKKVYERCLDPVYASALYGMYDDDPAVNVNVFRSVEASDRAREGYVNLSDQDDDLAADEWICRYPSDLEAALYKQSHFVFRVMPNLKQNLPTDHVNSLFFLCYDAAKAAKVEKEVAQKLKELQETHHLQNGARVAPSAESCLDVVADNVSKAAALQFVTEHLELSMSDVISFGNAHNDAEMLSQTGKGCLMQNALPRLKEQFPELEVIGHHNEDGVALKLMEVFGLEDINEADDVDVHFVVREPAA